ncbi:MAG: MFS transporter [Thermoguttaceae bacterium]
MNVKLSEQAVSDAEAAGPATRTRYVVVALCVALAMITYLDRACISTLAKDIRASLSLSETQMSLVFSAFALAYAAFEIPTAWWADRAGTRRVLTRIVIWWSMFTIATAGAFNHLSLIVVRFLFGAGEAGAWPSAARTFSRWIPRSERGKIQGIFFAGAHLAGGITPVLVIFLLNYLHWRAIFVLFGMIGFVWAAVWWAWFRDDPEEHPAVGPSELARIAAGRETGGSHHVGLAYWQRLATHRNIWALCLMYFANSYSFYFCITWLPTYLEVKHGVTATSLGLLTGLPLLLSVLGDLFGGVTTDWAVESFGPRIGRCALGGAAYLVAAVAMGLAALSPSGVGAAIGIAVAVTASMFTLGAAWSTCLDIGGNHAGVVSAAMNTSGQVGSVLCPIVVIWLKDRTGDWNSALLLISALFLVGAVGWALIDPNRKVFDDGPVEAAAGHH